MNGFLAAVLSLLSLSGPDFIESHVRVDGALSSYKLYNIDADGRDDLVVVVRHDSGARALHIHYQRESGAFPEQPDRRIDVKNDVIAWGLADVRVESGRELLFFTRTGVHSYSPTREGYRDNAARLALVDLLFDTPDPRDLPFWPYVMHRWPHPDHLLLPGHGWLELWTASAYGDYRAGPRIATPSPRLRTVQGEIRLSASSLRIGFRASPVTFIVEGEESQPSSTRETLLHSSFRQPAPVFADVDGDGKEDLLLLHGKFLHIHRCQEDGSLGALPWRVEDLSSLFEGKDEDEEVSLSTTDLDRDGRADLIVSPGERSRRSADGSFTVDLYLGHEDLLVGSSPDRRFKFEALRVIPEITDVDGDGRRDLVVIGWNTPLGPQALAKVVIERQLLVFRGAEDGLPERSASIKEIKTYSPEEILALAVLPSLGGDFDGDGLHDLVELDREGAVQIRPLVRSSSLLAGASVELASQPLYTYRTRTRAKSVLVLHPGQDPVADLIVELGDELVLFVSRARS
ncbi:MAG: VCBS repeat-containing protein [Planctomycetota bacterium]